MADEALLAAARAIVADAADRDPWIQGLRLEGIGWASVELERSAEELRAGFLRAALPEPRWAPAARDDLLGATAWLSREWWPVADMERPPALVLLEPDTEGRLAATLARFDEGVAVVYLAARTGMPPAAAARLGRPAGGPLGSARLVLARPTWGPNVVVLDRPLPELPR